MKTLMINSTQDGLGIEIFDGENNYEKNMKENRHSETILVGIDNILKEHNIMPNEIECVAVCVGPGSFTGIRVAMSVAKAFAVAAKAKLIGFTTFDLFAYNKPECDVVVVKGFSDFNYIKTNTMQECLSTDAILEVLKTCKKIVCEKEVAEKLGIVEFEEQNEKMWDMVKEKIDKNQFVDPQNLDALYLRLSQAELARNKNGNV